MSEPIPAKAYEPRPVQVRYLHTSVLVEYVPARIERRRVEKAAERRRIAIASGDIAQEYLATVDFLAELLTGWQHRDRNGNPIKPTRAALERQPVQWLEEARKAIAADMEEFVKESGG